MNRSVICIRCERPSDVHIFAISFSSFVHYVIIRIRLEDTARSVYSCRGRWRQIHSFRQFENIFSKNRNEARVGAAEKKTTNFILMESIYRRQKNHNLRKRNKKFVSSISKMIQCAISALWRIRTGTWPKKSNKFEEIVCKKFRLKTETAQVLGEVKLGFWFFCESAISK